MKQSKRNATGHRRPNKRFIKYTMNEIEKSNTVISTEKTMIWKVHPVKRRPYVSILVSMFIFLVGIVINYSTQSQVFTILALIILLASLAKFYFPTSYELTETEIIIKTTTQTLKKNWSMFRSCYPDKNGILLSPFEDPSRLENFRGIYLMFHDNRDEVINFVKTHIEKHNSSNNNDITDGADS